MTTPQRYDAICRIFHEVSELEGEARALLLDSRCGDDRELRAEIDRLLVRDAATGGFLAAPPALRFDGEAEASRFVGRRFGGFEIVRVIAAGGMGIVYEAEQERPRRRVALKLMRSGLLSESARRRFEIESELLARLNHPGIARVFEVGVQPFADASSAGPIPYIAMELVEGARSLPDFADGERLDARARLALFAIVCDGVHHGHQRGVIHRDLKPSNLLVDAAGRTKVIDFGIARAATVDGDTKSTRPGELLGTLAYMSPEQWSGDLAEVDVRSDVYSLGVVLYELLCGVPPCDLSGLSITQALERLRDARPARPSAHRRELRGDLETILLKALEREPARRYQSAAELADDLRRHLGHQPIRAAPASAWYRTVKFVRRHRVAVGAGAIVVVALVAGTALSLGGMFQAKKHHAQALLARDDADEVVRMLGRMIAEAGAGGALGREATLREGLDWVAECRDDYDDRPLVAARLAYFTGAGYYGLGLFEEALPPLRRAAELYTQHLPPTDELTHVVRKLLIETLRNCGRLDEALVAADDALARSSSANGADSRRTAVVRIARAHVLLALDRGIEAEGELARAIGDLERVGDDDDADLSVGRYHLAMCLKTRGKHAEEAAILERLIHAAPTEKAEQPFTLQMKSDLGEAYVELSEWTRAQELLAPLVEIESRVLDEADMEISVTIERLASACTGAGDPARALPLFEQALARLTRFQGANHRETLKCRTHIAATLESLDRGLEAVAIREDVVARLQRDAPTDRGTLIEMGELGSAYMSLGKLPEAKLLLVDALDGLRKNPGIEHPSTLIVANNLALLYRYQRRFDDATAMLEEILAIQQRTLGEDNLDTLLTISNLASMYAFGKHPERGEALARRSVELHKAKLTIDHPRTWSAMHLYSFVLSQMKRHDDAIALAQEVLERRRDGLGETHSDTRVAMRALAGMFADAERYEESRDLYEQLFDVLDDWHAVEKPSRSWLAGELAWLCEQLDDKEMAARWRERGRERGK